MRFIHNEEKAQRGCFYCLDAVTVMVERNCGNVKRRMCPHDECPYHELDGFKTYADYMKSTDSCGFAKLMDALKKCDCL